jgi:hypothetical protein
LLKNRNYDLLPPSRLIRGTLRPIVTKREEGCGGRKWLRKTSDAACGRAKACGPDLPTLNAIGRIARTQGWAKARQRRAHHHRQSVNAGGDTVIVFTLPTLRSAAALAV